jgi:hypothetical protein
MFPGQPFPFQQQPFRVVMSPMMMSPVYNSYSYYGNYSPPYTYYQQRAQQTLMEAMAATNSQNNPSVSQMRTYGESKSVNVLDTLGVPNDGNQIRWPIGLTILPPAAQTKALRERIDALAAEVATQAANHQLNSGTLQEANKEINKLHGLLFENRFKIPALATYNEADHFLNQLKTGLKNLPSAASASTLRGNPSAGQGSLPYSP